ncbi:MAG TPA: carboxypeptidase-like regulatory domain-containing protein [Planctomycetota bacterium]|jgi:hypothetical protein|nr:carboxypeptidase-like regulatory domain-containing protein [Planctomycetota bacterium]
MTIDLLPRLLAPLVLGVGSAASPSELLRGSVRTRSGEPVPRAEIRLQKVEEPARPGPPAGIAREDGSFEIEAPGPGTYAVWASAPGYLDGRGGPLEVKAGAAAGPIDVALFFVGRASATLTVLDLEGQALEGVSVEAVSTALALGTPVRSATGPDGRARFAALNAGGTEFALRLRGEGAGEDCAVETKASRPLKADQELALEVRLARPTQAIEGRALDASGAPLPEGRVVAVYEPNFMERYTFAGGRGASGTDGSFRVGGLVAGEYRLRLFGLPPGGGVERLLCERVGVRPQGEKIDLVVGPELPVLVEGTCVNVDTGAPIVASEARIEVGGKIVATDKSDAEGRFSLASLLSKDLPNILRVTHKRYGYEERWLRASEVRPDGRYPDQSFAVSRRKPEDPK